MFFLTPVVINYVNWILTIFVIRDYGTWDNGDDLASISCGILVAMLFVHLVFVVASCCYQEFRDPSPESDGGAETCCLRYQEWCDPFKDPTPESDDGADTCCLRLFFLVLFFGVPAVLCTMFGSYYLGEHVALKRQISSGNGVLYGVSADLDAELAADYSILVFQDNVFIDRSFSSYYDYAPESSKYYVTPVLDDPSILGQNATTTIPFWALNGVSRPHCTSGTCVGRRPKFYHQHMNSLERAAGGNLEQAMEREYPALIANSTNESVFLEIFPSIEVLVNTPLEKFYPCLISGMIVPLGVCLFAGWWMIARSKNQAKRRCAPGG
uniref:Uncharacterized protein n=1 Tax=Heterosigma akashiwo TaxID=2829 RepID=A0A7S3YMU5_HETAK